jgi:hypothetical protein
MKYVFSLLCLLLNFTSATPNDHNHDHHDQCPRTRHGCLCQDDVDYVLSVWPRLFDTEDATFLNNTIKCIVTDDFVSNNEGRMIFGITNNGIDIPSRDVLQSEQLGNIQYEAGYPNTRGYYTQVFSFFSCDQIAFRWQYNGTATGNTKW